MFDVLRCKCYDFRATSQTYGLAATTLGRLNALTLVFQAG